MMATRFGRRALISGAGLATLGGCGSARAGFRRSAGTVIARPKAYLSTWTEAGVPLTAELTLGPSSWCEGGRHCCIVNTLLPTRVRAVDDRRVPVARVRAPTAEEFPGSTKSTIHDPMESQ